MIKVLLISSSLKNKGGITSVIKGYLNYPQEDIKFSHISSHKDGGTFIKLLYFIKAYFLLFIRLCFQKFDAVHIHVSERGSFWRKFYLYKICRIFNKRVILHHHGAEFIDWYKSLENKKQKKVEWLLQNVSVNIVLSSLLKNVYNQIFQLDNISVVYNGIQIPQHNPYVAEEKDIILFLGRIGERKGAYDLIEAIRNLDIPQKYKFYFCGDGERKKLEGKIESYDLSKRVIVKGWVSGKEKEEILNRTLINVLPSYNEGLPMTILETMARGIPNISTNIASIPEAISNGENGILIIPGDFLTLSNAMRKLITDKGSCDQFSEEAKRTICNKFLLKSSLEKLEEIYLGKNI